MTDEDKAPYVAKAQETRLKWEKELQIYKHELKNGVRDFLIVRKLAHLLMGYIKIFYKKFLTISLKLFNKALINFTVQLR